MTMMKEEMYQYEDDFIPYVEQVPEELDWMIKFLLAKDVTSILTLGISRGGVEYRIAEAYQKANRRCRILGVDWAFMDDTKQTWAKVLDKFPLVTLDFLRHDLTKFCPYFMLGNYEFCFIDADHAYTSVKRDFGIAIKHTKRFVGFHDIRGTDVTKFWEEIKQQYPINMEMATSGWMGIGIASVSNEILI